MFIPVTEIIVKTGSIEDLGEIFKKTEKIRESNPRRTTKVTIEVDLKEKKTTSGRKRSISYKPLIIVSKGQCDNVVNEYTQGDLSIMKELVGFGGPAGW